MSLNVKAIKNAFAQDNGYGDFESMRWSMKLVNVDMSNYTDSLLEYVTDHGDEFWED